jgi:hypothetical protein
MFCRLLFVLLSLFSLVFCWIYCFSLPLVSSNLIIIFTTNVNSHCFFPNWSLYIFLKQYSKHLRMVDVHSRIHSQVILCILQSTDILIVLVFPPLLKEVHIQWYKPWWSSRCYWRRKVFSDSRKNIKQMVLSNHPSSKAECPKRYHQKSVDVDYLNDDQRRICFLDYL